MTETVDIVSRLTYLVHQACAKGESPRIRASLATTAELAGVPETEASYYLTPDRQSGFMLHKGHLKGLFSLVPGRGALLVSEALRAGASLLDCYDGYLPMLYARHGFVEISRSANWTEGGPDVVVMAFSGN